MNTSTRPVALVTGANRGIGRGVAFAMADKGFDVIVNDIEKTPDTEQTLAGLAARGASTVFAPHDISSTIGHAAFIDRAFDALGRLDCLVNNAGVQVKVRGDLLDVSEESFDRLMNINLRGTFFLTQGVAKRMLTAPASSTFRSIITISSSSLRDQAQIFRDVRVRRTRPLAVHDFVVVLGRTDICGHGHVQGPPVAGGGNLGGGPAGGKRQLIPAPVATS